MRSLVDAISLCDIVSRIGRGESAGERDLHLLLGPGLLFLANRQLRCAAVSEHVVEETLSEVSSAIREGSLRVAEATVAYARTVLRRNITRVNEGLSRECQHDEGEQVIFDGRLNPEDTLLNDKKVESMRRALKKLKPLEREALERFYLHGEAPERVCAALGLTESQFRLLKSSAKSKFESAARRPAIGAAHAARTVLRSFASGASCASSSPVSAKRDVSIWKPSK